MIEIVTYHNTINYGALIQSLALKDFIQKNFKVKVKLCDYHPKKLTYSEKYRPLVTKNFYKFFGTIKKNFLINSWKKTAFLNQDYDSIKSFTKLNIYGSDEIWNVDNAYHGYDPFYFGKNHDKIKIAYAASVGRTNLNNVDDKIKEEIRGLLKGFSGLSVRDENTAEFVFKLTNIMPEIVLDPTLIHTPKILESEKFINQRLDYNYALVYGTVFSKSQRDIIFNYCKKKNLKVISVGYFNKWINKNFLGLNPTTFYNFIKNSNVVFTSMFHGIMFSTKLNKQFYFSSDPIRSNKIKSFINEMNLQKREIKDFLDKGYIDYNEINKKLNYRIMTSQRFLIESIEKNLI
jgi:hypothetical protein